MSMFTRGDFTLASGLKSEFKIDCDILSDADIDVCAWLLSLRLPAFSAVEGVPSGGLRLAAAMEQYKSESGPLLIVDDVWTTGSSMEKQRAGRDAIGAVIFCRPLVGNPDNRRLDWLEAALFVMMPENINAVTVL